MAAVNEAWRVLSDSERRAVYDLARRFVMKACDVNANLILAQLPDPSLAKL